MRGRSAWSLFCLQTGHWLTVPALRSHTPGFGGCRQRLGLPWWVIWFEFVAIALVAAVQVRPAAAPLASPAAVLLPAPYGRGQLPLGGVTGSSCQDSFPGRDDSC